MFNLEPFDFGLSKIIAVFDWVFNIFSPSQPPQDSYRYLSFVVRMIAGVLIGLYSFTIFIVDGAFQILLTCGTAIINIDSATGDVTPTPFLSVNHEKTSLMVTDEYYPFIPFRGRAVLLGVSFGVLIMSCVLTVVCLLRSNRFFGPKSHELTESDFKMKTLTSDESLPTDFDQSETDIEGIINEENSKKKQLSHFFCDNPAGDGLLVDEDTGTEGDTEIDRSKDETSLFYSSEKMGLYNNSPRTTVSKKNGRVIAMGGRK